MTTLLIDNYDSFTYNLAQYLWELGATLKIIRNDELSIDELATVPFERLIVSPGPGTPNDAGISLPAIKRFGSTCPVLGVCLGHQCLGQLYGAAVERIPVPKHGKVSTIKHDGTGVFAGLSSPLRATRYHSLVVAEHSVDQEQLSITAWSEDDGYIMGLQHRSLPLYGVQFHPESLMSEYGHALLANFLKINH